MIGTYKLLTDGSGELYINPYDIVSIDINYNAVPINLDDKAIEYIRNRKAIVTIYFDNGTAVKITEEEFRKLIEYLYSVGILDRP